MELPSILGPIKFPSICCIINIININHIALIGETNNIIITEGMAPINGPKKGIIFVTPIITDTNNAVSYTHLDVYKRQK